MSSQQLAINFNVVNDSALRQELQKAQDYINALNTQVESLQTQLTALQNSFNTLNTQVQKYIAAHP